LASHLASRAAAVVLVAFFMISLLPLLSTAGDDSAPVESNAITTSTRAMTAEDVSALTYAAGTWNSSADYNVIIDGHGTGYVPPTAADYSAMVGDVLVLTSVSAPGLATSIDLSTDPCFPVVGNQLQQGSCAAWAMTYYCYGYLEAKDNGWTDASLGNSAHLLSPTWTYNKVNGGSDSGSWMGANGDVLCTWGGATLSTMPYTGTASGSGDILSWGDEAAFREAPLHRAYQVVEIPYTTDNTMLDMIKAVVASGTPVTFAMNAYCLQHMSGDDIITSSEYSTGQLNHAQTIVGYDDSASIGSETGMFKVVNSWGADFAGDGYYWMTYSAFKKIGSANQIVYIEDRADYQPSILGVWHYSSAPTEDGALTVKTVGGTETVEAYYLDSSASFPKYLCLDLTDLKDEYDSGKSTFALKVTSGTTYVCTSFRTELYPDGYVPGSPAVVSDESPTCPSGGEVRSTLGSYAPTSLSKALDTPLQSITSGGSANWTAVDFTSVRGSFSVQSGDVSDGSTSWLSLSLPGPGLLSFDWSLDCPVSTTVPCHDRVDLIVNGVVATSLSGSQSWTERSIDLPAGTNIVTWAFLRDGNGGGAAWVDDLRWDGYDLHIDSDLELRAVADLYGWPGTGASGDPILIDDVNIGTSGHNDVLYVGNTTLWLEITGSTFTGATSTGQAGLHLFNSENVTVRDCSFEDNDIGLVVDSCSDITIDGSVMADNAATGCSIADNSAVVIRGGNISANGRGLDISGSAVAVNGTVFFHNTGVAIDVASSPACQFWDNIFVGNNGSGSVYDSSHIQAFDASGASWNGAYGNYWADWTTDVNGDGLADAPYDLSVGQDNAPLSSMVLPPTNLVSVPDGQVVHLTWNEPAHAVAAIVEYEVSLSHGGSVLTFTTTSLSYTDTTAKPYGTYTYTVRAITVRGAGTYGAPSSVFVPDHTSPTVAISSPQSGSWVRGSVVRVSWTGSDVGSGIAYYEISVDSSAPVNMSQAVSANIGPLGDGSHSVTVTAFDLAGNSASSSVSFNVDSAAPTVTVRSPSSGQVVGTSAVSFSISIADAASSYHHDTVKIDGVTVRDSTSVGLISFSYTLGEGAHKLLVISTDQAGNMATATVTFTVDASPPAAVIDAPAEGSFVPTNSTVVSWSASDTIGIAAMTLSLDGGEAIDVSGLDHLEVSDLADGAHNATLIVTDLFGRAAVATTNFTVDARDPTVALANDHDLPVEGPVVLVFSEEVNATSLVLDTGDFDATWTWNDHDLIITPTISLDFDTVYQVTVAATDLTGHSTGTVVLTFLTTDRGMVRCFVVDGSGDPLANATIDLGNGISTITGEDGSFSVSLHAGAYNMTVSKDGYEDATYPFVLQPGQDLSLGTKSLEATPTSDGYLWPLLGVVAAVVLVVAVIAFARRKR
jgi:hypothetical protein